MASCSKRAYSSAFPATPSNSSGPGRNDPVQTRAQSPASHDMSEQSHLECPSSLQIGFIPGQWEDRSGANDMSDDAAGADRDATLFTTVGRFAPSFSTLCMLYNYTAGRIFGRYTFHQQIRAEHVDSEDGARKKIYIDCGLEDRSSPSPSPSPRRRQDAPTSRRVNAPSGLSPTRPQRQSNKAAPENSTSSSKRPNTHNGSRTKHRASTFENKENLNNVINKENPATNIGSFDEEEVSPILSRVASLQKVAPLRFPVNRRVFQLSDPYAHRTKVLRPAPPRQPILDNFGPRPVAQQQRIQAVVEKAKADTVRARAIFQCAQDAKQNAKAQAGAVSGAVKITKITSNGHKSPDYVAPESTEPRIQDDESLPTGGYENDLSFLPDAPTPPEKKKISFNARARVKRFTVSDTIQEMPDSSAIDVVFSPGQQLEDSLDDSVISVEAIENTLEKVTIIPDSDDERTPTPTPELSMSPAPIVLEPLLPELHTEQLEHILKAAEKTKGGRIEKQLVEGKISTHDLKTLLPHEFTGSSSAWLNDNIVNEYLNLLVEHEKKKAGYEHRKNGPAPAIHAFPSQWFSTANKNMKNVAKWAFRKQFGGKNLLDVQLLLIPICDGNHWRLMAIKPQEKTIEYLDSLHMSGKKYIDLVRAWLAQELNELYVEDEWTVVEKGRSRFQRNGSDCGVFVCMNALTLIRGEEPDRVQVDDGMKFARRHMAVSLLSQSVNGVL